MKIEEIIKERHSVRNYLDTPLPPDVIEKLTAYTTSLNDQYHINIATIINEPRAFGSFLTTYGKFKNVRNYMVLIGDKNDADTERRLGYAGELAVLYAKSIGLDTCWVGLTFSKSKGESPVEYMDHSVSGLS